MFGAQYLESLKRQHVNTDHVTLTKGVSCGIAQITVAADGSYHEVCGNKLLVL